MFYIKLNLPSNFILKGFSVVVGCSVDGPSVIGSVDGPSVIDSVDGPSVNGSFVEFFIVGPTWAVINIISISPQHFDNHNLQITT